MRELLLKWDGTEYRCRVTHDLIMQIENRVVMQELAARIANGAESNAFPTSHIAWVYYCVLRSAGAPVTSDQVWDVVRNNAVDNDAFGSVISFLFAEVYGVGPSEEPPEGTTSEKKA